jgi:hypothetical protein
LAKKTGSATLGKLQIVERTEASNYDSPIFTYSGRGTTKPGVRPSEHAVIYYASLQTPTLLPRETGITKLPIGLHPGPTESKPMAFSSRINFGKVYPVEWNVKVKDLGRVIDVDMAKLGDY